MAAEAVLRIKEAEDAGSELIRRASEEARDILKKAESDGAAQKKAIIAEAERMKAELIEKAVQKAEADCAEFVEAGRAERDGILRPQAEKLEKAAQIATERIVKTDGDR